MCYNYASLAPPTSGVKELRVKLITVIKGVARIYVVRRQYFTAGEARGENFANYNFRRT